VGLERETSVRMPHEPEERAEVLLAELRRIEADLQVGRVRSMPVCVSKAA
jgi:hypothetical protein